jgi:hypothetical protein
MCKDGLVTSETEYWSGGFQDPQWELDRGSLYCKSNQGYTGNSGFEVFRLYTKPKFLNEVTSFNLFPIDLLSSGEAWDGVHIFLRVQSEYQLYYASVLRRDGSMLIKKKCPGGPDNGGTYDELSPYAKIPTPQRVAASVKNLDDGSVQIQILDGSTVLLSAIDNGIGKCAPITQLGKTGIRGDNLEFTFDHFSVTAL